MKDLEQSIASWRENMGKVESIDQSALEELESHLRDAIEFELASGSDADTAFELATNALGDSKELAAEFRKANPEVSWAKRLLWMISGIALLKLFWWCSVHIGMLVENLVICWFPGVLVSLPAAIEFQGPTVFGLKEGSHALSAVHIGLLASNLTVLILSCAFMWLAIRWVQGRSRRFERCFSPACSFTSMTIILMVFAVQLLPIRGFFFRILGPIYGNHEASALGMDHGEHEMLSQYFGYLTSCIQLALLFGFTFWVICYVRQRSNREYAGWMLAGCFAMPAMLVVAATIGSVVGAGALLFDPSERLSSPHIKAFTIPFFYHSVPGLVAQICTIVIGSAILVAGLRLACSSSAPATERVLDRLRHSLLPLLTGWAALKFVHSLYIFNGITSGHRELSAIDLAPADLLAFTYRSTLLLPWLAVPVAVGCALILTRQNRRRPSSEPIVS